MLTVKKVEGGAAVPPRGPGGSTQVPIGDRCADCHRPIAPDGSGHLSWCPFDGYRDFPRLRSRHPTPNIGE